MTPREAIKQQQQIEANLQAEIEAGRVAEAERNRQMFDTSIVCAHRMKQYIVVGEFTFQLCPKCLRSLVRELAIQGKMNDNPGRVIYDD